MRRSRGGGFSPRAKGAKYTGKSSSANVPSKRAAKKPAGVMTPKAMEAENGTEADTVEDGEQCYENTVFISESMHVS